MSAVLTIPGRGAATSCEVCAVASHRPTPLRFVWHHEQPESAGGATDDVNLIQLCDNCHYSVHRILYALKLKYQGKPLSDAQQGYLTNPPRKAQLTFAQKGFDLCVAAGTVDEIPNEGLNDGYSRSRLRLVEAFGFTAQISWDRGGWDVRLSRRK